MNSTARKYHHYIGLSNPYRTAGDLEHQPPAWALRGEITTSPHPSSELIEAKGDLGNGWATCCNPIVSAKKRSWTSEQKARNRRLRLWRRLQKHAPLFAHGLFIETTERRPGYYYRGETPRLLPLSGQHAPTTGAPRREKPVVEAHQQARLDVLPPIRSLADYQRLIQR